MAGTRVIHFPKLGKRLARRESARPSVESTTVASGASSGRDDQATQPAGLPA